MYHSYSKKVITGTANEIVLGSRFCSTWLVHRDLVFSLIMFIDLFDVHCANLWNEYISLKFYCIGDGSLYTSWSESDMFYLWHNLFQLGNFLLEKLGAYESAVGDANTKGAPRIETFPPAFQAVPRNPIVLDLAYNSIEFPALDNRMKKDKKGLLSRFWGWLDVSDFQVVLFRLFF